MCSHLGMECEANAIRVHFPNNGAAIHGVCVKQHLSILLEINWVVLLTSKYTSLFHLD